MIRGTMMKHLFVFNQLLLLTVCSFAQNAKPTIELQQATPIERHLFELEVGNSLLSMCNLEQEKTYTIRISTVYQSDYAPKLKAPSLLENATYTDNITLQANAACMEIEVSAPKASTSIAPLLQLSVACIDCEPIATAALKSDIGILVDQNPDEIELIEEVFIGGNCFDTENITSEGDPEGRGTFSSGSASIGIEEGIIISTGNVNNAAGANTETGATSILTGNDFDPDLANLSGGIIGDYSAIEFDFTPTLDNITFEYVFASEEYCDFVGSDKNDVFGFFLSGPGINGPFTNNAINIATLPGTNTPVTINNVNSSTNAEYYLDNVPLGQTQSGGSLCTPEELNTQGVAVDLIQFDGFTTVLTAVANVIPCETYHIKLAIADVTDDLFDSAVFLKANSFTAGGAVQASSGVSGGSSTENQAFEGCGSGLFTFTRLGEDNSVPVEIDFTLSPLSTATEGIDFAPLPNSLMIPAGEDSVVLTIDILSDALMEGQESIILDVTNSCSCTNSELELQILDPPPFMTAQSQIEACEGVPLSISPSASGGVPGYTYLWQDGSTGATLEVIPEGTSTYAVEVTDGCGQVENTTVEVMGISLSATMSGTATICPGITANLQVDFTGSGPWDINYEVNNQILTVSNITENPYALVVDQVGTYTLLNVNTNGCEGTTAGIGEVNEEEIFTTIDGIDLICADSDEGSIELQVTGGTAPYTFDWNNGFSSEEDLNGLPGGTYDVLITDALGCNTTNSFTIEEYALDRLSLQVLEALCEGERGSIAIEAPDMGVAPYVYSIDGGANFSSNPFYPGLEPGNYDLLVQDLNGCESAETITLNPPRVIQVEIEEEIVIPFGDSTILPTLLNIPIAEVDTILWTPTDYLSCEECLNPVAAPLETTNYRVQVVDQNGCSNGTAVRVVVDRSKTIYVPNAFSPTNLDGINDNFMIYSKPGVVVQINSFQVYSRWGQLVYEDYDFPPNDPAYGWDGMNDGKMLNPGVFVYYAEVELIDGTVEIIKGDVALVD